MTSILGRLCPYAKATDTAVGINVQPQMRERAAGRELIDEQVARVRLQLCARQQIGPRLAIGRSFDRSRIGKVALEVIRVDLDALHDAFSRQLHDDPVVSRSAASARLPA